MHQERKFDAVGAVVAVPQRGIAAPASTALCFFCCAAVSLLVTASSAASDPEDAEPPPPADAILENMRDLLPRVPLLVHGQLATAARKGRDTVKLNVDIALDWSRDPLRASYTIRDAFGLELANLQISRTASGAVHYAYSAGSPLEPAPLPDLYTPLQATDVAWADLSLSFLWWKGGRLLEIAELRGEECYVLDVPAPAGDGGYGGAVMWIDRATGLLIQADAYDRDYRRVRRVIMRSIKKVDGEWIAKDIDIMSLPSGDKTRFRVRHIERAEAVTARESLGAKDD